MSEVINEDVLRELIEKRDTESATAYTAFLKFARLPESDRRSEVANPILAEFTGLSINTIKQYRHDFEWDERASMIDAYHFKLDFEANRKEFEKDRVKYIEHNRQIKEKSIEHLKGMSNVIGQLISYGELIGKEEPTDFVETKDGRTVPTYTVVNMKAKVADIATLMNSMVKLTRLVNDLPTTIIENRVAPESLNGKTKDELDAIQEQIAIRRREIEAKQTLGHNIQVIDKTQ